MAVSRTFDAGLDRPRYSPDVVDVDGDIRAPIGGGVHGRLQLVLLELDHVERVEFRHHAAAGHQFDLRRSEAKLFAGRGQNLIATIRQDHQAEFVEAIQPAAPSAPSIRPLAEIAVAGRLADRRPRGVNPWAIHEAFIDRPLQSERRPGRVADGGKPSIQHLFRFIGSAEGDIKIVSIPRLLNGKAERRMGMGIDQPRHQNATIRVENAGSRGWLDRSADFGDLVANYQEVHAFRQALALAIQRVDPTAPRLWRILLLPSVRYIRDEGKASDNHGQREWSHGTSPLLGSNDLATASVIGRPKFLERFLRLLAHGGERVVAGEVPKRLLRGRPANDPQRVGNV